MKPDRSDLYNNHGIKTTTDQLKDYIEYLEAKVKERGDKRDIKHLEEMKKRLG